jgi:hypothetical protein
MMATRHEEWLLEGSSRASDAPGTPISEMLKRDFLIFGVPKQIETDKCPDVASKSLSNVLASLGIKHRTEV